MNRYELETLTRRDGLVALTLGAEGAVLLEDGEEIARAKPPQVDAVDGTAAGDAFTACLLVSLLEERDHDEALSGPAPRVPSPRRGSARSRRSRRRPRSTPPRLARVESRVEQPLRRHDAIALLDPVPQQRRA